MAIKAHVRRLKGGAGLWNKWRDENPFVHPDLMGANLGDLSLRSANLMHAKLGEAELSRADFSKALMFDTYLCNVDLRNVKGLESVIHMGPSTIDIDTVYRSKGEIPDVFLRGCGVPEDMIGFIHGIRGAIQFYSCFISYSTKDEEFAKRIHADLQAKGVRCWFAPHDMQGGRKVHEQIDEAIRLHDKLLLILSPNSIESEWVKTETIKARNREIRDNARVLFPVRLCEFPALEKWRCFDTAAGVDHAPHVREFYVPDFSAWKTDHDAYSREFEKLLRDLKPSA